MNKNMLAIIATIEGLRNLDNWAESDAKKQLIGTRDSMKGIDYGKDILKLIDAPPKTRVRYADPMGREISLFEWAITAESCNRHIEEHYIKSERKKEPIRISTVWLGLNHSFFGHSLHVFETMIFGIEDDEELKYYQERYGTVDEAEEGHQKAYELVKSYLKGKLEKKER